MENIDQMNVPSLHSYLKERGVTYSGYRKPDLIKLVKACSELNLPTDPNFVTIDIKRTVEEKLAKLDIVNPMQMDNKLFSTDLSQCPTFGLYDIFNYLLKNRADYDRKKLKAYKSATDYR